jgi:hypothetical protein
MIMMIPSYQSHWYTSISIGDVMVLIVVGFTTTFAISCEFEPLSGEVYPIQHYVIKFVSDLRHVGGFLQVLIQFPPSIKQTATLYMKYLVIVESVIKHHKP